jgi:hypothetical protein
MAYEVLRDHRHLVFQVSLSGSPSMSLATPVLRISMVQITKRTPNLKSYLNPQSSHDPVPACTYLTQSASLSSRTSHRPCYRTSMSTPLIPLSQQPATVDHPCHKTPSSSGHTSNVPLNPLEMLWGNLVRDKDIDLTLAPSPRTEFF